MKHSKSSYLKDDCVYTINSSCKKPKKFRRRNTRKELAYDANIGHRLYVKSRGASCKREQSIKRIKHRRSMREMKKNKELANTITMSENSKWILEKKAADNIWAESSLSSKDLK